MNEELELQHTAVLQSNAIRDAGFELQGADGHVFRAMRLDSDLNNPKRPITTRLHEYDGQGVFVDDHEVEVPGRIQETQKAIFPFTERHKKAFELGTAALTVSIAVGSLMVYRHRKHHS